MNRSLFKSTNVALATLAMFSSGLCVASEGHVENADLYCPAWVNAAHRINVNQLFIEDVKRSSQLASEIDRSKDRTLNRWILKPEKSLELKQQYDDMVRTYQSRQHYDLNDRHAHSQQLERSSNFKSYFLRSILSYQLDARMSEAEKNHSNVRTFREVQTTVESVAKGDVSTNLIDELKFGLKTDLPGERGQVWFNTPIVNSSVDVVFGEGLAYDPFEGDSLGNDRSEQYRLIAERKIPGLEVDSKVTYGTTSTKVKYQLSKQLHRNLRAEVSATRGIDPGKAELTAGYHEEVRLDYSVRF